MSNVEIIFEWLGDKSGVVGSGQKNCGGDNFDP